MNKQEEILELKLRRDLKGKSSLKESDFKVYERKLWENVRVIIEKILEENSEKSNKSTKINDFINFVWKNSDEKIKVILIMLKKENFNFHKLNVILNEILSLNNDWKYNNELNFILDLLYKNLEKNYKEIKSDDIIFTIKNLINLNPNILKQNFLELLFRKIYELDFNINNLNFINSFLIKFDLNQNFINFISRNLKENFSNSEEEYLVSIIEVIFKYKSDLLNEEFFHSLIYILENFELKDKNLINIIEKFKYIPEDKVPKDLIEIFFEKIKTKEISTYSLSNFLYWLSNLKDEKIPDWGFDYFIQKYKENSEPIKWIEIIKIIFALKNKENKEEYNNFIIEIMENHIENIDMLSARNILFLLNDILLDEKYTYLKEELFKIIEIDDTKEFYIDKIQEIVLRLWLKQIYKMYSRNIPKKFKIENNILNRNLKNNSNFEKEFYNKIIKFFPEAKNWFYIDWFELDIYIKELNLNIEIDWRHHTWIKKIKDNIRDNYLENKGLKIVRINTYDIQNYDFKSKQDILNLIKD